MKNSKGTELRNRMISSAISYNKHLDRKVLKQKPSIDLIKLTHPVDREDFDTEYLKIFGHRIAQKIFGNES